MQDGVLRICRMDAALFHQRLDPRRKRVRAGRLPILLTRFFSTTKGKNCQRLHPLTPSITAIGAARL